MLNLRHDRSRGPSFPQAVWIGLVALCGCARWQPAVPPALQDIPALPSDVLAQELTGPLTESEAIGRALLYNDVIISTAGESLVAELRARREMASRDPELRLGVGREDEVSSVLGTPTADSETDIARVALRVYPANPMVRRAVERRLQTEQLALDAQLREAAFQVAIEVRRLMLELRVGAQRLAFLDDQVRQAERDRRRATVAREAGVTTTPDAAEVSAAYLEALASRCEATRQRDDAAARLARLIGFRAQGLELAPVPSRGVARPDRPVDELVELALQSRSAAQRLGWRRLAARYALAEARWQRLPWIAHLQGSYGWSEQTRQDTDSQAPPVEDSGEEWRLSAAVTLPFDAWGGGRIDVLKQARQVRAQEEHAFRRRLEVDIRAATSHMHQVVEQRDAYVAAAASVITELDHALSQLLSVAVPDFERVAQLRRDRLRVELRRLEFRAATEAARLELESLLGWRLWGDLTASTQ